MSIHLITGLPGNAKTLFALGELLRIAKADNRPVFYSGINELSPDLGWVEIDPLRWFDAPTNSLVIIDESQRVFRPRGNGTQPPQHVVELETHRHGGIDLYLLTQHPMLVDSAVRRLTQQHQHMVRIFGMEASTVHRWDTGVVENCEKAASRKTSIKTKYIFDKKLYPLYKSANAHTMKRNIPKRIFFIALIPVAIFGALFYMYKFTDKKIHPVKDVTGAVVVAPGVSGVAAGAGGSGKISYKNAVEDAHQYVFERTARVNGLPQTAPQYDELTKPSVVPVPAACVSSSTRCSCFTQQGTPLQVGNDLCAQIVANGYFQDFEAQGKRISQPAPVGAASSVPVVSASTVRFDAPSSVSGASGSLSDGYGVLGKRRGG